MKNMSSSVGMIIPYGKIKTMIQTTNQSFKIGIQRGLTMVNHQTWASNGWTVGLTSERGARPARPVVFGIVP